MRLFCLITIILMLLISGFVNGAEYIFPRDDGSHFTFESHWENLFEKTNNDDNKIVGQHYFRINNLSLPIDITLKRMALDSNDCYMNDSWDISVIITEGSQIITEMQIRDERSQKISLQSGILYGLTFIVYYDKDSITEGKNWAMIQMNIISSDFDEPHYFFQVINYKRLNTQDQPFSPAIPLILALCGIVVVIYYVKKQTSYITKEGDINALQERKEKKE